MMITMPNEIRGNLKSFSDKAGQTMSGVICQALREYLARQEGFNNSPKTKEPTKESAKEPKIITPLPEEDHKMVRCTRCPAKYMRVDDSGCPACGNIFASFIYAQAAPEPEPQAVYVKPKKASTLEDDEDVEFY